MSEWVFSPMRYRVAPGECVELYVTSADNETLARYAIHISADGKTVAIERGEQPRLPLDPPAHEPTITPK